MKTASKINDDFYGVIACEKTGNGSFQQFQFIVSVWISAIKSVNYYKILKGLVENTVQFRNYPLGQTFL